MTDENTTNTAATQNPPDWPFPAYNPDRAARETALHHTTALYGATLDDAYTATAEGVTRDFINTADAIAAWLRDGTKPEGTTAA